MIAKNKIDQRIVIRLKLTNDICKTKTRKNYKDSKLNFARAFLNIFKIIGVSNVQRQLIPQLASYK